MKQEQMCKSPKVAELAKEAMVEVPSISPKKMELNQEVHNHKDQLVILSVHLRKLFILQDKESVASTRIQAAKLLEAQNITFINKMQINKLFITFKTQILLLVFATRFKCIKLWKILTRKTVMCWIQRSPKTSTPCTSQITCQWPHSNLEENPKLV